jgi:hypothetical protein
MGHVRGCWCSGRGCGVYVKRFVAFFENFCRISLGKCGFECCQNWGVEGGYGGLQNCQIGEKGEADIKMMEGRSVSVKILGELKGASVRRSRGFGLNWGEGKSCVER